MSRMAALTLLAALALLIGFFAIQLRQGGDPSAVPSPLIGKALEPFALPALANRVKAASPDGLALTDLQDGKVHVVNFFASWCVTCRQETDALTALSARSDIELVGVDYKDRAEAGNAFLAELGDPYDRIGFDHAGRTAIDWGVYGVPETFVIDGEGRVVARYAGALTAEPLEKVILPAITAAQRPR